MRISLGDAVRRAETAEAMANGQGTNFKNLNNFFLKDKEKAVVKFLLNDISEVPVVRTHMVQLFSKAGKAYYVEVSCRADEGDCPFCEAKSQDVDNENKAVTFAHDRLVIPLVVLERNGESELTYALFTRSVNFYTNSITPYAARFNVLEPIELSRSGSGTATTYNMFPPIDVEKYKLDKSLDELKADLEVADDDIIGRFDSIIKTWTPEQMDFYLNTRQNPTKANMQAKKEEAPQTVTRRSANHHGF